MVVLWPDYTAPLTSASGHEQTISAPRRDARCWGKPNVNQRKADIVFGMSAVEGTTEVDLVRGEFSSWPGTYEDTICNYVVNSIFKRTSSNRRKSLSRRINPAGDQNVRSPLAGLPWPGASAWRTGHPNFRRFRSHGEAVPQSPMWHQARSLY